MSFLNTAANHNRFLANFLWVGLLLGMLSFGGGLYFLTEDARREFNELATASTDNRQWNLAQAEVEYLRFQDAVLVAAMVGQSDVDLLQDVRLRFDIFYSRIVTVRQSSTLEITRQNTENGARLDRILATLNRFIPSIDGDDPTLVAAFPQILADLPKVFDDVRQLSLNGTEAITRDALNQRASVTRAFQKLGGLTVALVVVLLAMVGTLFEFIRRERRQAKEKALIAGRMTSIIETAIEGVVAIDADGKIIEFNPAAEAIFGYSVSEALGQQLSDLLFPQSFRRKFGTALSRLKTNVDHPALSGGTIEIEACRKSGEVFPAEISVSASDGETGQMYFAFVRDISERVAAQKEIETARDRALAGEKTKSRFMAVMSHEMRTPLNGILGSVELMRDTRLTEHQKDYVEAISASGAMLLQHVNNVLDISCADDHDLRPNQSVFRLKDIILEVAETQKPNADSRGNKLEVNTIGLLGSVEGDALRLKQVLTNLLDNAIKFTSDGNICIETRRILNSDQISIKVKDSGIGINRSNLDQIFEDFATLDDSFSRAYDGTGLGLSVVKRLVHIMGGQITVESQPGSGSVFEVRLPLPKANRAAGSRGSNGRDYPTFGLSVLVVEDNRINRMVVRQMLAKFGCGVEEAVNGQEGVKAATRNRYDLILMDISMPVMDGVTATGLIRKEGLNLKTPIYALTAHAQADEIKSFERAGIVETIVKPINTARLRSTLEKVVSC